LRQVHSRVPQVFPVHHAKISVKRPISVRYPLSTALEMAGRAPAPDGKRYCTFLFALSSCSGPRQAPPGGMEN
jgi:hypothetical protein